MSRWLWCIPWFLILVGCATLVGPERVVLRTVEVKVLPPYHSQYYSSTDLKPGPYTLTEFEYQGVWHIFGPTIARWAAAHVRIGTDKDFPFRDGIRAAGYYFPQTEEIILRAQDNEKDSQRFANLIHEVTHYWEFHRYRHPRAVEVSKENVEKVYRLPEDWVNLNIEQEAELVSVYAVLAYLFNRDDQRWRQFDNVFTREDLPRFEEYMRREMYF